MGKGVSQYGNFVRIPYNWLKLCRKYPIQKVNKKGKDFISINLNEICLLARIAGWNDNDLPCTETNTSLAEFMNVTPDAIKKYINELRTVGFIKTYEEKDAPVHTCKRTIYVQYDFINMMINKFVPIIEESCEIDELGTNIPSVNQLGTNVPSTGYECKPNNTNNTIFNNKADIYEEDLPFGNFSDEWMLPTETDVNNLRFLSEKCISDDDIKYYMKSQYKRYVRDGVDDVRNSLIYDFTSKSGWYKCRNNEAVSAYADYLLLNPA